MTLRLAEMSTNVPAPPEAVWPLLLRVKVVTFQLPTRHGVFEFECLDGALLAEAAVAVSPSRENVPIRRATSNPNRVRGRRTRPVWCGVRTLVSKPDPFRR